MAYWIGETWRCMRCYWVNANIRHRCRNCGEYRPGCALVKHA